MTENWFGLYFIDVHLYRIVAYISVNLNNYIIHKCINSVSTLIYIYIYIHIHSYALGLFDVTILGIDRS